LVVVVLLFLKVMPVGGRGVKIKLLLADKSEIFCEGLAKLLEREPDIEVVCARTGLEAIERANEHQPDVILIDTELPECSGIETMQRIHERLPNTNIIVLTHSDADADLISAVRAGARAYISKDVSLEDLIKVIALVAEHEVIVSPPMAARLLAGIGFLEEHKGTAKVGGVSLLSKREQAVLSLSPHSRQTTQMKVHSFPEGYRYFILSPGLGIKSTSIFIHSFLYFRRDATCPITVRATHTGGVRRTFKLLG